MLFFDAHGLIHNSPSFSVKAPEPKTDQYFSMCACACAPLSGTHNLLCSHTESGILVTCTVMEKHGAALSGFQRCKISRGDAELRWFVKCIVLRVGRIHPLRSQLSHVICSFIFFSISGKTATLLRTAIAQAPSFGSSHPPPAVLLNLFPRGGVV